MVYLAERLNFDTLFRLSEPKRVVRSRTVRGPSLDIEAFNQSMLYWFNFKSSPSTEKKRHKGYIKFFKPRNANQPLSRVDCEVDCDCKDYRFRYAWVNKQRGSGKVGAGTLNQCINRAPRFTNPENRPGLCKHLIALKDYLYGQMADFLETDELEDSRRLERLVRTANGQRIPVPEDPNPRPQTESIVTTMLASNVQSLVENQEALVQANPSQIALDTLLSMRSLMAEMVALQREERLATTSDQSVPEPALPAGPEADPAAPAAAEPGAEPAVGGDLDAQLPAPSAEEVASAKPVANPEDEE